MIKVFYNPTTLEIKGFSDAEGSMDFPFVETDTPPLFIQNFRIVMTDGVASLAAIKAELSQEDVDSQLNK